MASDRLAHLRRPSLHDLVFIKIVVTLDKPTEKKKHVTSN